MEQLPKIVRERLAATARPGVHPDPDLLTAFTENSLPAREQTAVLDHLAHCAECREAIAVAMPQMELEYAAAVPAAAYVAHRSSWFGPGAMRWAALAAAVVLVGAAALVYRQAGVQKMAHMTAARQAGSAGSPADTVAKLEVEKKQALPQSAPAQNVVSNERRQEDETLGLLARPSRRAAKPVFRTDRSRDLASSTMGGPVPNGIQTSSGDQARQTNSVVAGEVAQLAVPRPAPTANAPATPADKDKAPASPPQKEVAQAAPPPPPPPPPKSEAAAQPPASEAETVEIRSESKAQSTDLAKAKAAPQVHVSTGAFAGDSHYSREKNLDLMRSVSNTATPGWVLSDDGTTLLRSTDGGKTWQTISVAPHVVFMALDAFGSQVWAGGGAGVLYHSADAGAHWVQVKPVADGKPLTDDVTQIHFSDAQHGELVTLQHHVWSTSDGGQTWQLK